MHAAALLATLVATASVAATAAPDTVVGTWKRERAPGVAGFADLTFTKDGRLLTGGDWLVGSTVEPSLLGRYTVKGQRVIARGVIGETYAFELGQDGRLCVHPAPGFVPIDGLGRSDKVVDRQCYRRSARAA